MTAPRSFGEDRAGNVWIGFSHGLARYAHGRFRLFTASEGLPPGRIMNIHVDRSGRLWLASEESGLVRVDHAWRGATGVCQLHDEPGTVEQQHRSHHRRRPRAHLRGRRAWTRPPRSVDRSRQAFHGCRWPGARSVPGPRYAIGMASCGSA